MFVSPAAASIALNARVAPLWQLAPALLELSHRMELLAMDYVINGLTRVLWEFPAAHERPETSVPPCPHTVRP